MIHPTRARLAVPTLAALACLTAPPFNATAMLMTATQPAFTHLSPNVEELCGHAWAPSEIVAAPRRLFSLIRRTKFVWPAEGQFTGWRDLADELSHLDPRQALVVVNLKRHAQTLLQFVPGSPGVFHLSTALCPAHRRTILEAVRDRLKRHAECLVISTQCVEAGVDLDFPRLYRALGPLEAIAQAAGRCNRNGRPEPGTVTIFRPEPDARNQFPDPAYGQAAQVTETLLRKYGGALDPSMPEIFDGRVSQLRAVGKSGAGRLLERRERASQVLAECWGYRGRKKGFSQPNRAGEIGTAEGWLPSLNPARTFSSFSFRLPLAIVHL